VQYYYLVASLPYLQLEQPMPLSGEKFLELCADWVTEEKIEYMRELSLVPPLNDEPKKPQMSDSVSLWHRWESAFRGKIGRYRAARLGREPEAAGLPENSNFSEFERFIPEAFAIANPLERTRFLDTLRWRRLDDLEFGHSFDFDILCIYRLRQLLLEKIAERNKDKGYRNLDSVVGKLHAG